MPGLGLFSPWSRRGATMVVLIWWALLTWQHRAQFQALGEQSGLPRLASDIKCAIKNGASAPVVCPRDVPPSNKQRQE